MAIELTCIDTPQALCSGCWEDRDPVLQLEGNSPDGMDRRRFFLCQECASRLVYDLTLWNGRRKHEPRLDPVKRDSCSCCASEASSREQDKPSYASRPEVDAILEKLRAQNRAYYDAFLNPKEHS